MLREQNKNGHATAMSCSNMLHTKRILPPPHHIIRPLIHPLASLVEPAVSITTRVTKNTYTHTRYAAATAEQGTAHRKRSSQKQLQRRGRPSETGVRRDGWGWKRVVDSPHKSCLLMQSLSGCMMAASLTISLYRSYYSIERSTIGGSP